MSHSRLVFVCDGDTVLEYLLQHATIIITTSCIQYSLTWTGDDGL